MAWRDATAGQRLVYRYSRRRYSCTYTRNVQIQLVQLCTLYWYCYSCWLLLLGGRVFSTIERPQSVSLGSIKPIGSSSRTKFKFSARTKINFINSTSTSTGGRLIKFSRGSGPTLRTLEYRKTVGPFYTDLRGTAVYSYIWHEYRRHLNLST